MPLSSYEIAAITGGFNQQTMIGMQHSAMISQQFGGYQPMAGIHPTPTQGENLTAMAMNAGASAGMGLMSGPGMNQGFMGGLASMGRGVLGQVHYGVQQQQMMDASMRQAFRHQNQFGGAGFTPTQLGGIRQDMLQMSQQRGSAGEQVTFEELGRLAQNMGRMGMSESVRGVKDFNEKFKEMLKTVKTVAQELGTSLEEAQKTMMSMQGSGVFGMGTQAGMLKGMARGTFAGGQYMSMAELSGAAQIGSQVSRSIGGRGVHGAMAGVEAMTQVGVMRNMGLVNEQDIYNMTGLSGSEGRQALMQQQLSQDADFLKSRHGRYFLASMMGEGGKIDEGRVQDMLSGGVSATDVYGKGRQRVNQNVYGFLRNEGHLRGQALAMGGGNLRASFYAMELQRRGFDLSGNDDRGMLALQKIGGMNREESEFMMNKIRNLGRMQTFREEMGENQEYYAQVEQQERKASPEDLIKDVEMAKQRVNNELRRFGADLYKNWAAQVDGAVKKMSGQFERRINRNLAATVRGLERGGLGAQMAIEQDLGMGTAGRAALGGGTGRALAEQFFGGTEPVGGGQLDRALFGRFGEIQEMGVDIESIKSGQDLRNVRRTAAQTAAAFAGQGAEVYVSQEFTDSFNRQMSLRHVQGTGQEFLKNFGSALDRIEGPGADQIREQWKKAKTPQEQAAVAKGILQQTNNAGMFQDRIQTPGMMTGFGLSKFGSTEEANLALGREYMSGMNFDRLVRGQEGGPDRTASTLLQRGKFLFGRDSMVGGALGALERGGTVGYKGLNVNLGGGMRGLEDWMGGGVSRSTIEGITGAPRSALVGAADFLGFSGKGAGQTFDKYLGGVQKDLTNQLFGQLGGGATTAEMGQLAEALRSDETFQQLIGLQTGDASQRGKARAAFQERMKKVQQSDLQQPSNQIEMARMKGVMLTNEYNEYKRTHQGKEPSPDWYKKRAQEAGIPESDVKGMINMTLVAASQTQRERQSQVYTDLGERAQAELVDIEKEVAAIEESDVSDEVKQFARRQRKFVQERAALVSTGGGDPREMEKRMRQFQERTDAYMQEERKRIQAKGGLDAQREAARHLTGFGGRMIREELSLEAGMRTAAQRQGTGGAQSYIAAQLGVGVSAKEAAGMKGRELIDRIMSETGLAGSEKVDPTRRAAFEKALQGVLASGKTDKEKAIGLADLRRTFSQDLTTASREKQEERAKETDPSYRMLGRINQSIKDIKDVGILNAINGLRDDVREKSGEGGLGGKKK